MKKAIAALIALGTLATSMPMTAHADDDQRRGNYGGYYNRRNDHDWGKGGHWNNNHNYYPRPVYVQPAPRVVYVRPQTTYYYQTRDDLRLGYSDTITPQFIQTFPGQQTTTIITQTSTPSYSRGYVVGGYVPKNRNWRRIPDYVRYGLPSPRRGEYWMGSNRDAILISEATSRIISGIILASAID